MPSFSVAALRPWAPHRGKKKVWNLWAQNAAAACSEKLEEVAPKKKLSYPLVMTNIAIENGHVWWIFPLKMVIFHSYVKLPEGIKNHPLNTNGVFSMSNDS